MIVIPSQEYTARMSGRPSAVALGYFDGLHIAHREIISRVLRQKEAGLCACVHTFSSSAGGALPSHQGDHLLSEQAKAQMLDAWGVDCEIKDAFTDAYRKMEPEEFFSELLVKKLQARYLAAGYDYRFGFQRQGDSETLLRLGKKYGVRVEILSPVSLEGELVSSTRIRQLLFEGDVKKAARFLGYPFFVEGVVQAGKQIGRTMKIRTANLLQAPSCILPKDGVYVTRCRIGNSSYRSLTNVGKNPTVGGKRRTVETHILNFDGALYGEEIRVELIDWIRGEIQFPDKEALRRQIEQDISYTESYDYGKDI